MTDGPQRPLEARVEGWETVQALLSPEPACIEPFQVRLPRIRVHLGRVIVRLPKARIQFQVPMVDGKLQMPTPEELQRLIAEAPWTPVETVVEPGTTDITPAEVQPMVPTADILPICIRSDFGTVELKLQVDPVTSRVTGCLHVGAKST